MCSYMYVHAITWQICTIGKLRTDGGAIREPASTSISTDLFSSLNLSQSVSHLSVTEANDKYCLSHGKQYSFL